MSSCRYMHLLATHHRPDFALGGAASILHPRAKAASPADNAVRVSVHLRGAAIFPALAAGSPLQKPDWFN